MHFACLSYLDTVAQSLPTGIIQLAATILMEAGMKESIKMGFSMRMHDPNSGTRSIKSRT